MSTRALVVGREAGRLIEVRDALERVGLVCTGVTGMRQAHWVLEELPVAAAVVHWDDTVRPLLELLASSHAGVPTVAVADASDTAQVRAITDAHPWALLHDARLDVRSLAQRVERLVGKRAGDLALRPTGVVHLPSGAVYRHPLAVRLVTAYPNWLALDGGPAVRSAVCRFRSWLRELGSCAGVESLSRASQWRLVVAERGVGEVAEAA